MAKKNKDLETFDIKERVIFSAGTHNGDMYTEADIAEIARAFEECKGMLRPPLKLGHSEDQGIWEMEGLPAIGWIDNVKKVGSDLVADFIKVPKVIYELITAGAYRTVSAEIYWNFVCGDKKYPYALKALALLGADIPAVKSVSDILSLYKAKYAMQYAEMEGFEVKTYEGLNPDKENTMPDEKTPEVIEAEKKAADELAAATAKAEADAKTKAEADAPLTAVVEELKKVVATLSEKKAAHETRIAELSEKLATAEKNYADANAKVEKVENDKRFSDLESKVDALIGDKKLMPAQKPAIMRLLSEIPLSKSFKDGELDLTVEGLLFNILGANNIAKLNTETNTGAGENKPSDEVAEINKISKDKGISYKEAYKLWKNKG